MAEPLDTSALPCPECRMRGHGGGARIGNRRARCVTCNNFAQNVMRLTRKRLKEAHPQEYETIRLRVELDLYPQVIETFARQQPLSAVRSVLPDDPVVAALERRMQQEYVQLYGVPDQDPDNSLAGAHEVLAYEDLGIIAWSRWENGDGKVRLLYVVPEARGQRVAEQLLRAAEAMMVIEGIAYARFETGPQQPAAMRLYERCGYERLDHGFGFYADNPGSVFYGRVL